MRTYSVKIYETNVWNVTVKAESVEDATEKVEKLYDDRVHNPNALMDSDIAEIDMEEGGVTFECV